MSNQNSNVLFLAGLVTGSLVGTGVALLLAPQSGAETRGQIKDKSVELKDGTIESLTEAGHRVQAQVATSQEILEKGRRSAAEAISYSIDNITRALTQNEDKVGEAVG
ncbi:YtxH domain-containing protein [Chloroflexota bacterium]